MLELRTITADAAQSAPGIADTAGKAPSAIKTEVERNDRWSSVEGPAQSLLSPAVPATQRRSLFRR